MTIRTLALVFAAVFVIIGLLGFMPAAMPNGLLFGLFQMDMIHNLVFLLSGMIMAGVGAGLAGPGKERFVFQVFGVLYGLIALVGFIQGYTVAGLFGVNLADNALHVVIALVALAIGFLGKTTMPAATVTTSTSGGPTAM